MLCQKCHKNEANIHISDASGETKATLHLCSSCAAEELAAKASSAQLDLSKLLQILATHAGAVAKSENDASDAEEDRAPEATCPCCGMTDVELEKTRRVGCAACYDVFREPIGTWIEEFHRDSIHRGTRPGKPAGTVTDEVVSLGVDMLKMELDRAVASEAYERAAELRDALQKAQRKSGS